MLQEAYDDDLLHGQPIRRTAHSKTFTKHSTWTLREVADLRVGGPTIFTPAEESELAVHCVSMAD